MKLLWICAFVAFAVDQISKYLVFNVMGVSRFNPVDLLPPLLRFRDGLYRHAAFPALGAV